MAPIEEKENEVKQDDEDEPIVKELKQLDEEYLKLEREFEAAERALRAKFLERQNPLLKQRAEILGDVNEAPPLQDPAITGTPALKGFWFQAINNHPAFKESDTTVMEWDEPVLEFLKDVTYEMVDAPEDITHQSFRLDFKFAENPFFEETLLSKTYIVRESSPWNGETEVKEIKSTAITWKAGKDVTIAVAVTKKKAKGGGAKKTKQTKGKMEPRLSFFRTFLGLNLVEGGGIPDGCELLVDEIKAQVEGDGEDGQELNEEESILGFMMERDFELGSSLKDHIVPYAVRWYTGEACPDGDDDDDDEESEEEDDDDDDEESEEMPKAKAKPKSKGPKPTAEEAAKKAEDCKQQ